MFWSVQAVDRYDGGVLGLFQQFLSQCLFLDLVPDVSRVFYRRRLTRSCTLHPLPVLVALDVVWHQRHQRVEAHAVCLPVLSAVVLQAEDAQRVHVLVVVR